MSISDVIVLGAGAAGLMCAIQAGSRGRKVIILDHANKPGKKILMSGGGRCNFTNKTVTHDHFISHNPRFCTSALARFTPQDFIDWVEAADIPYHEKTLGQLFCDRKSKDILNMLLAKCDEADVGIKMDTRILKVEKAQDLWKIETTQGVYTAESLVVATGGLSIPTMGATGIGYDIARQFGLKVWPTRAGLVPFTLPQSLLEQHTELPGISFPCIVSCKKRQFEEGMLFTHRGLSGPALLQISSYWAEGDSITINMLPNIELLAELKIAQKETPNQLLSSYLYQYLPKKIVRTWLSENLLNTTLQSIKHAALEKISSSFTSWEVCPNGTEGYRTAEVTLGGVDCNALSSKTFEAKDVPGLYFIGEVIDVTGWLGGYNFQWAWASGAAAGSVV